MRTSFRVRKSTGQIVLVGVFILWCTISLLFWNNSEARPGRSYSTLEIVRKSVVIPQPESGELDSFVLDSKRGHFSIVDRYLNKTKHGVFLEIGNDVNETGSLTYMLEKTRDWTGLQIVPEKDVYQDVLNMKRGAHLLNACIKLPYKEWPYEGSEHTPCVTPNMMVKLINKPTIDLLVLDIEGLEARFIDTFPFHNVSVSMVTLEIHGTRPPNILISHMNRYDFECVQIMVHSPNNKCDMIFRNRSLRKVHTF